MIQGSELVHMEHLEPCLVQSKCFFKDQPLPPSDFPGGSDGKESSCNAGDLSSISGLGRSPGEGKGSPLQYSGLENSMNCIVHGVTKNWTRLIEFHFHGYNSE